MQRNWILIHCRWEYKIVHTVKSSLMVPWKAKYSITIWLGNFTSRCKLVPASPFQECCTDQFPLCICFSPWIAAHQASLSITNSRSSLKLMSIESVMPSSHLILCRPLLLLPPVLPSIRVFSNDSTLLMRWPNYWSFSFSIIPSEEIPGLISFRMDWLDLIFLGSKITADGDCSHELKRHFLLGEKSYD